MTGLARFVVLLLPFASFLGQPSRSIDKLPDCNKVVTDVPAAWKVVDTARSRVTFRLPPDAKEAPTPQGCIHGCQEWTADGLTVRISFGLWGEGSFADDRWAHACRAARTGFWLVIMHGQGERDLVIWPVPPGVPVPGDYVIRAEWTSAAAEAAAGRIAGSVRLK